MAYVLSQPAAASRLSAGLSGLIATVKTLVAQRAVYARTMRELHDLSDRDLADLGIARSQIGAVAREASYSK